MLWLNEFRWPSEYWKTTVSVSLFRTPSSLKPCIRHYRTPSTVHHYRLSSRRRLMTIPQRHCRPLTKKMPMKQCRRRRHRLRCLRKTTRTDYSYLNQKISRSVLRYLQFSVCQRTFFRGGSSLCSRTDTRLVRLSVLRRDGQNVSVRAVRRSQCAIELSGA